MRLEVGGPPWNGYSLPVRSPYIPLLPIRIQVGLCCGWLMLEGLRPCYGRVGNLKAERNGSMIVGTGIDMVEVPRVAAAIARHGERFLRRIFTEAEILYCDSKANRAERYAARFAAKEAGLKAIGTGWRRGIAWRDVEVRRESGGRPVVAFTGRAAEFATRLGVKRTSLSLSHTADHAIAQVILED